ncbi:MAG: hypothetical protein COA63_006600 [Methylophaga sp.]|nr:hypothetical protein [Methylophaga sp.]
MLQLFTDFASWLSCHDSVVIGFVRLEIHRIYIIVGMTIGMLGGWFLDTIKAVSHHASKLNYGLRNKYDNQSRY